MGLETPAITRAERTPSSRRRDWEAHGKQRGKQIPASRAARQVSELMARAEPGSPLGQTAASTGPQSQKKKAAPQSGQELREVPSHAVRQHAGCAIGVNKLCADH